MAQAAGICGVILAAGASTRMGRDKALLAWPPVGEGIPVTNTFLGAMIDLLQQQSDLVIVVAGLNASVLRPIVYSHGAFMVVNPDPDRGQFSSIQTGLHDVLSRGRDAAFLAPVDRPPVLPGTLHDLRKAFLNANPEVWAVVPTLVRENMAVHGHPILLGRDLMELFLRAPANAVARDLEHQHREHIQYLEVNDPRVIANIDNPQDYERLARSEILPAESAF